MGLKVFTKSADYYDALYRNKAYGREAEFVLRRLKKHGAKFESVLELGCGTGAYTEVLARQFQRVVGVDCSAAMLRRARSKKREWKPELAARATYRRADLRALRLKHRFDVVAMLFHVLSYQTRMRDLQAAFRTAAQHVRPGGHFVFDFWYGPGVQQDPPGPRVKRCTMEAGELVREATPAVFQNRHLVRVHYDFRFQSKGTGRVTHTAEDHWMRYLFREEIEALSAAQGFRVVEFGEWMTGLKPTRKTWNAYAVTVRSDGHRTAVR